MTTNGHMESGHGSHVSHSNTVERLLSSNDATHTAIKNGNWSDPNTWKDGRVPDAEADVFIPANVSVKYDVNSETPLHVVRVDGELKWTRSDDTKMVVETIVTNMGSVIDIGSMAEPMPADVSADIVFRDTPITDHEKLSHGLVAFGEVDIQGAKKESHLTLEDGASKGATTVTVSDGSDMTNWKVGDTILLVGTDYVGENEKGELITQDEERVITSVNGNVITFDKPLQYDHKAPSGYDLDTYIGNLSRNVVFSSENPEGVRGHVMMHNGMPDKDDGSINCVRYAEFRELGRTDLSETIDDGNPIGRYPLHLHLTGAGLDAKSTSMIVGNSVYGSPGWGIVQHESQAMITDNIVYDIDGAGIVSETGDETGMWIGNLVTTVTGHDRSMRDKDDGLAYSNQSRVIIQQDNIAANAKIGWDYEGREDFDKSNHVGGGDGLYRNVFEREEIQFDPSPFDASLDHEEPAITGFVGNTAVATGTGFFVYHRQFSDDTDTMSVIEDFTVWGGNTAVNLRNYASNYIFKDSLWIGDGSAIVIELKTSAVILNNVELVNFTNAWKSIGLNHESGLIDVKMTNVENKFVMADLMRFVDDEKTRKELIEEFQRDHGIDYENPEPFQIDSSGITPVDEVRFIPYPDADLTLSATSSHLDIKGITIDSLGVRKFNGYAIARPPHGNGSKKDFEGVEVSFRDNNVDFTTTKFLETHGTLQKPDGSWVSPVVNWITDRLTGDQHPVVIEIALEGFDDAYLEQFALPSDWEPPAINNPDFDFGFDVNATGRDQGDSDDTGSTGGGTDGDADSGDNGGSNGDPGDSGNSDGDSGSTGGGDTGSGSDWISGGDEADKLRGTGEADKMSGGDGNDQLLGFAGDDLILGGAGTDRIRGDEGNDTLDGGKRSDVLHGGEGADRFVLDVYHGGRDIIKDFSVPEGDVIEIRNFYSKVDESSANVFEHVKLEAHGDDSYLMFSRSGDPDSFKILALLKNSASLTLSELLAQDALILSTEDDNQDGSDYGNSDPDDGDDNTTDSGTTDGGSTDPADPGDEVQTEFVGTSSSDNLKGSSGNDTIEGLAGNDTIDGGNGDDILVGGAGTDIMRGAGGADVFVFRSGDVGQGRDDIKDFSLAEGDAFDLSEVLNLSAGDDVSDFVSVRVIGSKAYLGVDVNGTGGSYVDVAMIRNGEGLSLSDLLNDGGLVL